MTINDDSRLSKLLAMLAQNAGDAFLIYAIALEYAAMGKQDEAIAQLRQLLHDQPDYLATYYQLGKFIEQAGNPDEAAEIYARGIDLARRLGDKKTQAELQAALDLL